MDLRMKIQTANFQPINFSSNDLVIIKSVLTNQKSIYKQLYTLNFQKEK